MIKNYFKTAFRNLLKNKVISLINLFGLSVGMTATVFIFLWVQNEITFDDYHPNKNNIYAVTNNIHINKTEVWTWGVSPYPLADAAVKGMPEVEKTAMVLQNRAATFTINNVLFGEKTSAYVDNSWFNMFHYDFVQGNVAAFTRNPFSVILTEEKAKKYFGDAGAIGQIIKLDTINYTVAGVIKNNPVNSSFQFDIMMPLEGLMTPAKIKRDGWGNFNYALFLQLHAGTNAATATAKLNNILNEKRKNNNDVAELTPLKGLHFQTGLQTGTFATGDKKTTYIFALLGLLLLITACINYVNLTTARASLRAKEVSVRKIIGAEKKHLFFQFIAESLVISVCCLVVSLVLLQLLLPAFNAITGEAFVLPLTSAAMWKVLLGTLLATTVLNGIYPALLLSSFKPLNVFRGKSVLKMRDGSLRKGLVVFQFVLSIMLIIGATVIYRQMKYIQTTNAGYSLAQIASMRLPYNVYGKLDDNGQDAFLKNVKHELEKQPGIAGVCMGSEEIDNVGSSSSGGADWEGRDTTFNPAIARLSIDKDFPKMFQLQLKEGRWFTDSKGDYGNFILNETAEQTFNMHKPVIGQRFTFNGDTGVVIGVAKDFHYKSMHEKIGPLVFSNNRGSDGNFFIKIAAGNIPQALSGMGSVWNKFVHKDPFTYNFLDDNFDKLYKKDLKTSKLIFIFSLITIIISALGLFGLAAFTAEQRRKEIGIRKVLGATVQGITVLLSKEFLILVGIAVVIASPVAWWAMSKWLEDFAYRTNLSFWIFIGAGLVALVIAILSVSVQAVKTALANPVKALRTE